MKRKILLFFIILISFLYLYNISLAADNSNYKKGIINTNNLNLRSGTDTSFPVITKLNKNEHVYIFGQIGEWYILQTEKNQVGVANSNYINIEGNSDIPDEAPENGLSVDENKILTLINENRKNNNLLPLTIDNDLQNLARLKAKDLVENNSFSHISPTYGTPFEMLKSHSVNYKTASENIAGNSDVAKAVESWLNSSAHRKNILSNDYNYTGIGVVESITYGKIIVELFIGK